jgi:transcriptional regulator with XRE-family HTH domain
MEEIASFGDWVRRRRKMLELTQANLAQQVGCSTIAIRKIEAGERRPSSQIAELMAIRLQLPAQEQAAFIRAARGEQAVDRLASPQESEAMPTFSGAVANLSNLPLPLTPLIGGQT